MIDAAYELLHPYWVVWMMGLFIGIVVWAYWPKRKKELQDLGSIPLRDDDELES